MKKIISIFLAISLMLCLFAGCSKKDTSNEESTISTTEKQPETSDETENSSTEPETSSTETETKKPTETTTEKPTTSAQTTVQLQKTYYGHSHTGDRCNETWLYFRGNGNLEVVVEDSITEKAPEYAEILSLRDEGIEADSHEHNGVKYYSYDGAGYISGYQVSGNKITTWDEGTFTIVSTSSIKRSDGVVFNIISDNSRFE